MAAEGDRRGASRFPQTRTLPPHRAGPRNQRRGPFSSAITAVRYAFPDDRAGLLLL